MGLSYTYTDKSHDTVEISSLPYGPVVTLNKYGMLMFWVYFLE